MNLKDLNRKKIEKDLAAVNAWIAEYREKRKTSFWRESYSRLLKSKEREMYRLKNLLKVVDSLEKNQDAMTRLDTFNNSFKKHFR